MATQFVSRLPNRYRAPSPFQYVSDGFWRDLYFHVLLLSAPIQSILLFPIQGSTPAFVLTLLSLVVLIGVDRRYLHVLGFCAAFFLLYYAYLALSISGYLIDDPDISRLMIIREIFISGHLRQTHITQGFYLFTALLFTYLIYEYYQEAFIKIAFYGILVLAAYGFYEFVYYYLYATNGDFLSNRNFGDLDTASAAAGERTSVSGSFLQQSNLLGPSFMRLKSLVGEPSMYALTVTPFAVYAFGRRWWLIFAVLTVSLVLSTSTTAVIGLGIGITWVEIRQRQEAILYVAAGLLVIGLLYLTADPVREGLNTLLFQKLDSRSGDDRMSSFLAHIAVVADGNPIRALFGLGFGTVRSNDMFSNLLANVGLVGLLLYSTLLLLPCFLMRQGEDRDALTGALLAIFVMEMATVPEYGYLPPWFMIALGYARVREQRSRRLLTYRVA